MRTSYVYAGHLPLEQAAFSKLSSPRWASNLFGSGQAVSVSAARRPSLLSRLFIALFKRLFSA